MSASDDVHPMSMQEIVVMIHQGEYSRAIAYLENEIHDQSKAPTERLEYCKWLAECNQRLEEFEECGNWYIEAVSCAGGAAGQRDESKTGAPTMR